MNGLWKVAVCMVAVLFSTGIAHGRDLRWRDVRVEAQLTRQGILHVQEYLTLVFTGNWNGAERRFRFRTGERIHVKGIYRIRADDGRKIPLARGDLDLPGHWNWWNWGRTVLRWRIRKPGDPVFHGTRLTFLLDYTIDGALVKTGEQSYLLQRRFVFPGRYGPIDHFSLTLIVDPSLRSQPSSPIRIERQDIPGEEGLPLSLTIHSDHPLSAIDHTSLRLILFFRLGAMALCILVLAAGAFWFFQREKKLGRFDELTPSSRIDESWLKTHLLPYRPELASALLSGKIDNQSVAALLARLVQEKKLASRVITKKTGRFALGGTKDVLSLRLLVPRSSFSGYERDLIEGLFIDGDETDPVMVWKHYRGKNVPFSPLDRIGQPLKKDLEALLGREESNRRATSITIMTLLGLLGSLPLIVDVLWRHTLGVPIRYAVWTLLIGVVMTVVIMNAYDEKAGDAAAQAKALIYWQALVTVFMAALLAWLPWRDGLLAGAALLAPLVIVTPFLITASDENAQKRNLRRSMGTAARYLFKKLGKDKTMLTGRWYPYLVGFGLTSSKVQWENQSEDAMVSGISAVGEHSGGFTGFTGGGGQFGGAGASGDWLDMVDAFDTSSADSGGSGAGSGDGGGGGW